MNINSKIKKVDEFQVVEKTKGKWFDLVLANIIAIIFVVLGLNVPLLSFALAFIVMAYMQVGLYGFVLMAYRGQQADFESIFLPFKSILKILCIKIIAMAGIVVWGLLFVVPGIIYGLNCSFSALIFFENPDMKIKDIFARSKSLVYGKRLQIFLVMLGVVLLVCLAASLGVGIHFLLGLLFKVPVWLTVVLIILPSVVVLIVVSLPLFETYLVGAYEDSLLPKNNQSTKPEKQTSGKKSAKKFQTARKCDIISLKKEKKIGSK